MRTYFLRGHHNLRKRGQAAFQQKEIIRRQKIADVPAGARKYFSASATILSSA
jgi:hypothetical protein